MGASRKLQGEIDRVLKKVQEGVDVFDSIWNKVYDTDNANQKEKFEADLKKEIKKLQRYRDQIKTWIQSSEIKDKKVSASYEQALMDARKLIEREMERFKICEKETKTKAFSKEGLGQQPKTDPREKAKSETRDWLNNVVGELENQIDTFEAELEGLSVKKGKQRPPRLVHLETSIVRHKAHIMKLELILRLLDNDELSPEQVNDVKDFLDDYVERNQEDFDEFSDVDELYSTLPLDKVESLEDLVTVGPPGLVKGVTVASAVLSVKNSLASSPAQSSVSVTSSAQQAACVQDQADETASQDSSSEAVARTPPPKSSAVAASAPTTPAGSHATQGAVAALSPTSMSNAIKEDDVTSFPGRKPSPALNETALRGVNRGSLSNQPVASITLGSGGAATGNGGLGAIPSASEVTKRNTLGSEDRLGSNAMGQALVSPLANRMMMSQAAKATDGIGVADGANPGDATVMTGRVFSPSVGPGMQWRPGSSFQNQNEAGQFRGRTEIAPDQREKFLQRFQQVQQQGQSNLLGIPPLSGGNLKQFSSQQQNPLLPQFNSQSSSVSPQLGLGVGVQASSINSVASSASLQQQPDAGHSKVEDLQQQQTLPEDSSTDSAANPGPGKNLLNEDDMKASYGLDTPGGVNGSIAEPSPRPRDIDLSPGQPLQSSQPSGSLGVIGRRSVADLGAIGDNLSASTANSGGMHDQLYNLQMLESAFYKLPQPKDSERAKSYTPSQDEGEDAVGKGVPDFWLIAMKNNDVLSEEITERDEGALKFLKDIKWAKIDNPKGFKLEFFFDTNPYFKNTVLTKTYHMIDEDEPILEKALGTEIEWYPGKCLTQKILKKKPKKGSKNAKPITKTEQCESFFNFFSPPQVPEDEADIDEDAAEELQSLMEQDYDVGSTIRDKIIPHAVSWFTGEAAEDDFADLEDDDDDDEDDDDEDDDDEDDDDEDEEEEDDEDDEDEEDEDDTNTKKKSSAARKRGVRAHASAGSQAGERPPECKQQ